MDCEHVWSAIPDGKLACRKCGDIKREPKKGNPAGISQKPTRSRCPKCGRKIRGDNHKEHCKG